MLITEVNLQEAVKEVLVRHQGRASAIKAGELAELFGYKDDRPIRLAIRELRKELPILSVTDKEPKGYFMAETQAEFQKFKLSTRSRLIEDAIMLRDVRAAFTRNYENVKQVKLL